MSSSVTRLAALLAALVVLVANHDAFAACDPENALYEDDFEFLDVSWGRADESILVDDGALVIWWCCQSRDEDEGGGRLCRRQHRESREGFR